MHCCRVSIVAEQFVRMLHHVGMPAEDADFIQGEGAVVNQILLQAKPRNTLFTGSGRIAEKLAADTHGKVSHELSGFSPLFQSYWGVLLPMQLGDMARRFIAA